jgi:hypothetical protein
MSTGVGLPPVCRCTGVSGSSVLLSFAPECMSGRGTVEPEDVEPEDVEPEDVEPEAENDGRGCA